MVHGDLALCSQGYFANLMLILLKKSLKLFSGLFLALDEIQTVTWLKRPDIWAQILALPLSDVYGSGYLTSLPQLNVKLG